MKAIRKGSSFLSAEAFTLHLHPYTPFTFSHTELASFKYLHHHISSPSIYGLNTIMKLSVILFLTFAVVALQFVQAAPMDAHGKGKAPAGEGSKENFNAFIKEDFEKVDPK